jgi:hypothetical protein
VPLFLSFGPAIIPLSVLINGNERYKIEKNPVPPFIAICTNNPIRAKIPPEIAHDTRLRFDMRDEITPAQIRLKASIR